MPVSSAPAFVVGRDPLSPVHATVLAQSAIPSSADAASPSTSTTLAKAPTPSRDASSVGRTPPSPQLAMALTQSAPSLYSDIFRFKAVYTITLRGTDSVTGLWFDSKELLPPSTNPSKSNQTTANPAFETGQFYAKMDGLTAWNKNDSLNVDPVIFQYNKDIDNNEYADSSQFYYSGYTVTIANPKDKTSTREMPVVNVNSDFPKFLTSQNLLFSQVVLGSSSFPGTSAYSDSGPGAFRLNPTDVFNVPPSAW